MTITTDPPERSAAPPVRSPLGPAERLVDTAITLACRGEDAATSIPVLRSHSGGNRALLGAASDRIEGLIRDHPALPALVGARELLLRTIESDD